MSIEGEVRERNINILNYLKKTIPNCKFNIEVFKNEKIFIDTIDYAIAILKLTNLKPLTKEEFRSIMCEFKPTIAEDSEQPEWSQGELDKAWDFLTGEKRSILTHGQDLKPLSEKEVYELISEAKIDIRDHYTHRIRYSDAEDLAKLICSHFSKQIKYPEKKENKCIMCSKVVVSEKDFCFENQGYHIIPRDNIVYNEAISDMRKLNGEGGV